MLISGLGLGTRDCSIYDFRDYGRLLWISVMDVVHGIGLLPISTKDLWRYRFSPIWPLRPSLSQRPSISPAYLQCWYPHRLHRHDFVADHQVSFVLCHLLVSGHFTLLFCRRNFKSRYLTLRSMIWAVTGFGLGQVRTLQRYGWLANAAVFVNLMIMFITMGVSFA